MAKFLFFINLNFKTMEEKLTTGAIGKKYGLIYGLVGTLVAVIPMVLEVQVAAMAVVPSIIAAIMFVIANKEFRTDNGGFMSFGEGFKINITIAAIAGTIRSLVSYVYIKFIDPTYTERMKEVSINSMRERGMSEEQIEQGMQFAGGMQNPELGIAIGVLWAVLGGLIIGSIVAAVIKNENEDSF